MEKLNIGALPINRLQKSMIYCTETEDEILERKIK